MIRDLLRALLLITLLIGPFPLLRALYAENPEQVEKILKVKAALTRGKESLRAGHFREAVDTLEAQLTLLDDNRVYLNTLRDAYVGLLAEMKKNKQLAEVPLYERRLRALDPGAMLELKTTQATATEEPDPCIPKAEDLRPIPNLPGIGDSPWKLRNVDLEATSVPDNLPSRNEVDPFSDANSVGNPQASKLLDQAEEAYQAKQYDKACQLFEQAAKVDAKAVQSAHERWAYCKLHCVVKILNDAKPGEKPAAPQALEREVRQAMSMSVNMKGIGNDLLERIKVQFNDEGSEATGASVQVTHQERQENGWSVSETSNFRIFHRQQKELAVKVAQAAEAARSQSARKWFGEVPPIWSPRCEVYLHLTSQDYSEATKQPVDCPGHSTVASKEDKLLSRRIDLHVDNPNMIRITIPHETTHIVLAGRFGNKPLPRWVDEGMAVLSEPRERVEVYLRNLPGHRQNRQLFVVAELMQFNEYPEGKYINGFYAQSVSLVDYLCSLDTPQKFARFLDDAMRGGFEPALREHYNIQSFAELENRWVAAVFKTGSVAAVSERRK